jgi:cell wall integrity and stress response component
MTRTLSYTTAVSLLALFAATANAQATTTAVAGPIETLDCYSSAGNLESLGTYTFQAAGYCQEQCTASGKLVMATTEGSTCLCGDSLPPASDKVDSSKCDEPCDGFDQQNCGGKGYFQIYLTGLGDPDSESSGSPSSGNSASATSAQPSVITKAGQTIVVTASASAEANSSSGGGGSSKVGIAVGVVVGVVVLMAIIGVIVFVFKRRRNREIEEEHRRTAAVSSFVSGGKSETSSTTDQRLDPKAFGGYRRESVGSIADERDFSRRILQVS